MNLLRKLKSNEFALAVAILSVIVQSFHSYTAFYNISSLKGTGWGICQAVLFAAVFDFAILFYTVRNKKDVVLGASIFMVIINIYYYYQHLGLTFEFIFGCLIAMIIPTTQYYYSEEIKEPEIADVEYETNEERELREANNQLQHEADKNRQDIRELDEHLGRRLKDIEELENHLFIANKKHDELFHKFNEAIHLRDLAVNSESVHREAVSRLSERLGIITADNFELKKRLGDVSGDLNPEEEAAIIANDIVKAHTEEVQDKSLLNVDNEFNGPIYKSYNPTRSDGPVMD
jgi:hypothetical protein